MKKEYWIYSIFPGILFFAGVMSLFFLGLSTKQAVIVETKSFEIFLKSLLAENVLVALIDMVVYLFTTAVVPLLPLLFLSAAAFLLIFLLREKARYYFLIFLATLLALTIVITNFSIIIILTSVGILVSSALLYKTFEAKRSNFSTANSLVSDKLVLLSAFIAIGLFLSSFINYDANGYGQMAFDSFAKDIAVFSPNATDINQNAKEQETTYLNAYTDKIIYDINSSFAAFPLQTRQSSIQVHDTDIDVINSNRQNAISLINSSNITSEEQIQEYISQYFPMIEQAVKILPLALAASFYFLARVISFFIGLAFGASYSVAKRVTPGPAGETEPVETEEARPEKETETKKKEDKAAEEKKTKAKNRKKKGKL